MLWAPPASEAFTPQQTVEVQQLLELDQQQTGYAGEILGDARDEQRRTGPRHASHSLHIFLS